MQASVFRIWMVWDIGSDNGPCYTSQAYTRVMKAFSVNHIMSSPYYPQSNGLAEKYVQIVKCLFNKAKEEGKNLYKCLMIYHNTPLTGGLQSPMQILQGRSARSDLPMSNAARKQLGIQPEVIRNIDKHEVLPTHDQHVGKSIMYQDSVTKQWYPGVITSLCQEKRSYMVTTSDGVVYRKIQAHINLTHHWTRSHNLPSVCHRQWHNQTICSQWNNLTKKSSQVNNQLQIHTCRPKTDTKPQIKLDL